MADVPETVSMASALKCRKLRGGGLSGQVLAGAENCADEYKERLERQVPVREPNCGMPEDGLCDLCP